MSDDQERLEQLRAEARYRADRLALYRARTYSGRLTSPTRLRELERAAQEAQDRVRHAESERK
jgi:hypothetical protein